MRRLLITILLTALTVACSSGVPVAITNRSAVALDDVIVSGTGFSQMVGSIRSGEIVTTHVHPAGEIGLAIAFNAGAKHVALAEQGYFEGGNYTVTAIVNPDHSALVEAELRY